MDNDKEVKEEVTEEVTEETRVDTEAIDSLKEALAAKDSIIESLRQENDKLKNDLAEVNSLIEKGEPAEEADYMEDIV